MVIRIAKVFDGAVDGTPFYTPDHPRLEPTARTEVLSYLTAGAPLLATTATEPDFVDPARGEVVPMNFRTDGTWVWNDALTYYVSEYGYAPEPDFLAVMRATDFQCPVPTTAAVERALDELFA
ncbi:hypothetical protein [Catenulispora subtropica]|uniref:Uncharacterized protein n=1 Tax=Catenulispora subtropica TaxID=450798 RepID=A0ABP5EC29_9ACTN